MRVYLFSILIPTILERKETFEELVNKSDQQIKENKLEETVEIV